MQRKYVLPEQLDMSSIFDEPKTYESIKFDSRFYDFITELGLDGQIETCVKNKHKFTINKKSLDTMIKNWGRDPNIRTRNMFYF